MMQYYITRIDSFAVHCVCRIVSRSVCLWFFNI